MKKVIKSVLLMLAVAFAGGTVSAQMPELPQIPVDTAVITGRLDNGLTYYIRHNETPKGQADFYIAQKVGSVLEEENPARPRALPGAHVLQRHQELPRQQCRRLA